LIETLTEEIERHGLLEKVAALVSDNSDDFVTRDLVARMLVSRPWLSYRKNDGNVGYDGNLLAIYGAAQSEYLWLHGDDDMPEEGALPHLLEQLSQGRPDVLLVPFRQPETLTTPPYQAEPPLLFHPGTLKCLGLILSSGKLTSYALRKRSLGPESLARLASFDGIGWMHLILAFELLHLSDSPRLCTLGRFCSRSLNRETRRLDWIPLAFGFGERVVSHPFASALKASPVVRDYLRTCKRSEIYLTFLGATRAWPVSDVRGFENYGRCIAFSRAVAGEPLQFLLFVALRLRMARLLHPLGVWLGKKMLK
jgi:hypothetical protein